MRCGVEGCTLVLRLSRTSLPRQRRCLGLSPSLPPPLRGTGLCRRTTLRQAACDRFAGGWSLLEEWPQGLLPAPQGLFEGAGRRPLPIPSGWNRPWQGRKKEESTNGFPRPSGQADPVLVPSKAPGDQDRVYMAAYAVGPAASRAPARRMKACVWPACDVLRGAAAVG